MSTHGLKIYPVRGRTYIYHRATRTRIRAATGTPEFDAEVAAAEKSAKPSSTKRRPLSILNARALKRLPPKVQARLRKLARSIAKSSQS